ncbi:MAG: ROK family protein [Anaerolineales bacterium]
MSYHIAADVGGTQLRAACYSTDSLIPIQVERIATQADGATPWERLKTLIASVWPQDQGVDAIGVAAPGPLDSNQGVVMAAPNIPGWVDLPLRQELQDRFHIPVVVGNDANLAAVGEWKYGAGKGHHHLIYLTVSTGIGGGVIIDDRLLLGDRGLAAELGHVTVLHDGPLCGCGQRGHLEAIASGTAIARWVEEELKNGSISSLVDERPVTAKAVSKAAHAGDNLAIAALDRAGRFIGQALADYLHIFNPTAVIIGGGVSLSGDLLLDPLCDSLKKHVLTNHYLDHLTIANAALGDDAGLMGALALARELEF